jgi:hypothetical protein
MQVKVGGVLKGIDIYRKDGKIERYNKIIHNMICINTLVSASSNNLFNSHVSGTTYTWMTPYSMRTFSNNVKILLSGSYSQSGTVITCHSGQNFNIPYLLNSNATLYWEATGDWAWSINVVSGNNSINVSKSLSIAQDSSNLYYFENQYPTGTQPTGMTNPGVGVYRSGNNANRSISYSNGVFTVVNNGTILSNSSIGESTIRTIAFDGPNSVHGHLFQLPSPIVLANGEFIGIRVNDFVVTWTFANYQAVALPTCPISGITSACTIQRLIAINLQNGVTTDAQSPNRIWLIANGNQIAIPNDITQGAVITPAAMPNILQTLTATGSNIAAAVANNAESSNQAVATIASTASNVKQIVWGTTAMLFGIIEFDTPQTLNAGQVLTIGSRLKIIPDYSL